MIKGLLTLSRVLSLTLAMATNYLTLDSSAAGDLTIIAIAFGVWRIFFCVHLCWVGALRNPLHLNLRNYAHIAAMVCFVCIIVSAGSLG